MTQYCRYCERANRKDGIYSCANTGEILHRVKMKHTNKCKEFQYNPVDALRENVKGHKPTGRKIVQFGGMGVQITLKDVIGNV